MIHQRRSIRVVSASLGVIGVLALGACGIEIGPRGPYPKRVYTKLRTELVFDGDRISVEGTTECVRNSNYDSDGDFNGFVDSGGPLYRCSPHWFGKRLADGSALLVGAYSVTGKWGTFPDDTPPDLTKHRERVAKVPRAVIWLDDAESPTRGEYYYSAIALDDPRSRLTEISSEIVGIEEGFLWNGAVSDPANAVPWVDGGHEPSYLVAGHANVVLKSDWSSVPGLNETLARHREPTFLALGKEITLDQWRELTKLGLAVPERIRPYQWPSPKTTIFPVDALRNSREHFLISLRRIPTKKVNSVLQLMGGFPKGVLPMVATSTLQRGPTRTIDLGNTTVIVSERHQFLYGLYDPEAENIYRFFVVRFTPGKMGDVYTTPLR